MKTFKQYLSEKQNDPESLTYTHYSHSPKLEHLAGAMSGTGIRGAEQKRLKETSDSRIKNRVYFYPPAKDGSDLPYKESGLGKHVYQTKLTNMHDATKQSPESLKIAATAKKHIDAGEHPANAFELAVLNHGFNGYHTANMSVVLNRNVPVKYIGTHEGKTFGATATANTKETPKSILNSEPNAQGEHSSSSLSSDQSIFYSKNQTALKAAALSLKMQYGKLNLHSDHMDKFKTELKNNHTGHPL